MGNISRSRVGNVRPTGRIWPATMFPPAGVCLQTLDKQKFSILKAVTFVNTLPSNHVHCDNMVHQGK